MAMVRVRVEGEQRRFQTAQSQNSAESGYNSVLFVLAL